MMVSGTQIWRAGETVVQAMWAAHTEPVDRWLDPGLGMLGLLLLFLTQLIGPTYHAGPAVHHVQETRLLPLLVLVLVGLTGCVTVLPLVRLLRLVDGVPAVDVRIDEQVVVGWWGDRDPGVSVYHREWR